MGTKFKDVPVQGTITADDYFIGTRDGGGGSFTDYRYSAALVAGNGKKIITVGATAPTITDAFFSNTITLIVMDGQIYQVTQDFTQVGTTITGVTISFTAGRQIVAII